VTKRSRRERLEDFGNLLAFWGPLDDERRKGDARKAWESDLRRDLDSRNDATLDGFAARWQARYDEIEATRGTVTTRSNSLLLFVGVLTTGAGLIGQSLSGAPGPIVGLFIFFGVLLLYCAVGAAVLAIRAQRVGLWDSPRVDVADATDERSLRLKYAVEIYIAAEQNRVGLRIPVGILRDGQEFALAGIVLIALLAALSVTAAVLTSAPDASGGTAPPGPSVAPSVSPLPTGIAASPSVTPARPASPPRSATPSH
jgi:hypothetical protein